MGNTKPRVYSAPNRGSEHGVGWNWTTEAHRLGHEVWALVSPAHRDAIAVISRSDAVARGIHWISPESRKGAEVGAHL
jgi:hypothetical protein